MFHVIQFGAEFRQDARDFLSANQNVVRPFYFGRQAGLLSDSANKRHGGGDRESRGFLRAKVRAKQY